MRRPEFPPLFVVELLAPGVAGGIVLGSLVLSGCDKEPTTSSPKREPTSTAPARTSEEAYRHTHEASRLKLIQDAGQDASNDHPKHEQWNHHLRLVDA